MTQLLQQALSQVSKLSDSDQDAIAAVILAELADEERWQESFAQSREQLEQLANRARSEIAAGRVRNVGMDEL